MKRYPFAALAEAMGVSENQAVLHLRMSGSRGKEIRAKGMSRDTADHYAMKAGFHPYEIWLGMQDDDADGGAVECVCPGCDERFDMNPMGTRQYCSRPCRDRHRKIQRRDADRVLQASDTHIDDNAGKVGSRRNAA